MKRLFLILLSLIVLTTPAISADWIIHAAPGTNPFIGFSRVSTDGTHIESLTAMYGVDPTFSYAMDGWSIRYNPQDAVYSPYSSGSVFTIDDSWITQEIPYSPIYGSISVQYWAIEGIPPGWIGYSEQEMSWAFIGEYWIDWASNMQIRISQTEPSDFGKWLGDGSINPNYVEPIAPLKSNRGKHLGKQVK